MDNQQIRRLGQDIFATDQNEIQCDEAMTQMVLAANSDLDEADLAQQFGGLLHHLHLCANCAAEFALLQEVTAADQAELNEIVAPAPPENGRFPIWQLAKNALRLEFPGFAPTLGAALTRGEAFGTEPAVLELPNSSLTVEFDVGIDETNAERRELLITIFADDPDVQEGLEGSSLWLYRSPAEPVIQEQTVNPLGDVMFKELMPDTYTLRLNLVEQQVAISSIVVP